MGYLNVLKSLNNSIYQQKLILRKIGQLPHHRTGSRNKLNPRQSGSVPRLLNRPPPRPRLLVPATSSTETKRFSWPQCCCYDLRYSESRSWIPLLFRVHQEEKDSVKIAKEEAV